MEYFTLKFCIKRDNNKCPKLVLLCHKRHRMAWPQTCYDMSGLHDDIIKHLLHYWPFVGGIHRSTVNSPHKGQWRGALMYSLIWAWTNSWVNSRDRGDLRCYRAHYDVIIMVFVRTVYSETPQKLNTFLPFYSTIRSPGLMTCMIDLIICSSEIGKIACFHGV